MRTFESELVVLPGGPLPNLMFLELTLIRFSWRAASSTCMFSFTCMDREDIYFHLAALGVLGR